MKIKELKGEKWKKMGLYDNNSPTYKSVKAKKVIDVTSMCPKAEERVLIKYAKVTRGMIAQICDLYKKHEDLGVTLHYHINEMTPLELGYDEVFKRHCFGLCSLQFAQVIFDNQPKK